MRTSGDFADDLTKIFREVLSKLLEDDYQLPIIMTMIGRNGSMIVAEFTPNDEGDGLRTETLAERMKDNRGMGLPANMAFYDARGQMARVVISVEGERSEIIH